MNETYVVAYSQYSVLDIAAVRIKMELDANRKRNNGKRKP